MLIIRLLCVVIFASLSIYTAPVLLAEPNLFPAFFGAVSGGGWQGQFNLDFSCFLLLSGLWVAWRHGFSASGLALAPVAVFGGMLFLSAYLLILSFRTGGDVRRMMLGDDRAQQA